MFWFLYEKKKVEKKCLKSIKLKDKVLKLFFVFDLEFCEKYFIYKCRFVEVVYEINGKNDMVV